MKIARPPKVRRQMALAREPGGVSMPSGIDGLDNERHAAGLLVERDRQTKPWTSAAAKLNTRSTTER
jgi:hypothetical protein